MIIGKNPSAYIVLVKPHIEVPFPVNPRYFRTADLYNFLRNFLIYDILNANATESISYDFKLSQCMLSDTQHLALRYRSMGKDASYFPLVENYKFLASFTPKSLPQTNKRNLFFHGSRDNFIASLPFINAALASIIEFDVCLHVITNRSANLPLKIHNTHIYYYQYSSKNLETLLALCDFGLAPTSFPPLNSHLSGFLLPLIFPRIQKNMRYTASKLSENAGRSFLLAQAAMPFITTPSPEASHYFSSLSQTITCTSFQEVEYQTNVILTNTQIYSSISQELFDLCRTDLNFDQLTCRLASDLIKQSNG